MKSEPLAYKKLFFYLFCLKFLRHYLKPLFFDSRSQEKVANKSLKKLPPVGLV